MFVMQIISVISAIVGLLGSCIPPAKVLVTLCMPVNLVCMIVMLVMNIITAQWRWGHPGKVCSGDLGGSLIDYRNAPEGYAAKQGWLIQILLYLYFICGGLCLYCLCIFGCVAISAGAAAMSAK